MYKFVFFIKDYENEILQLSLKLKTLQIKFYKV